VDSGGPRSGHRRERRRRHDVRSARPPVLSRWSEPWPEGEPGNCVSQRRAPESVGKRPSAPATVGGSLCVSTLPLEPGVRPAGRRAPLDRLRRWQQPPGSPGRKRGGIDSLSQAAWLRRLPRPDRLGVGQGPGRPHPRRWERMIEMTRWLVRDSPGTGLAKGGG
jgi:hypothetical protein